MPTSASFFLDEPIFAAKLALLKSTDPALHDELIRSFVHATGMAWDQFERLYHWTFHASPHFSQSIVWGNFSPLSLPVEIYAAVDEQSGVITPISFWKPAYLKL